MSAPQRPLIRVLLVDDHAVVREGYRRLLERSGGITVVGEASNAAGAYDLVGATAPSVVVMDITLPGSSGIEVLRDILDHHPGVRVLMFSMHEDAIFARRALRAGAHGYVTKASAPAVLVEAVHAVADGTRYLSPDIARTLALGGLERDRSGSLSPREFEVLRLLAQGHSVGSIADSLALTAKTVANLQSTIKQKLGVNNPIQLLQKARELGLQADPP